MDERLNSYDWEEVFKYAEEPDAVEGFGGSVAGFTRDDVSEVIAMVDGENDGPSWVGAFRLADGRFAMIEAGCDYTGWGCREGGASKVAGTREELVRLGLTHEERQRLGLLLPGEEKTTGGEASNE